MGKQTIVKVFGPKHDSTFSKDTLIESIRIYRSRYTGYHINGTRVHKTSYDILPKKLRNALKNSGIVTVADLGTRYKEELQDIPGVGYATLSDLMHLMAKAKVKLRSLNVPESITIDLTLEERKALATTFAEGEETVLKNKDLETIIRGLLVELDLAKELRQRALEEMRTRKTKLEADMKALQAELNNL